MQRLPDQLPRHTVAQEGLEGVAGDGQHWLPDHRGQLYNQQHPEDTHLHFDDTGQSSAGGAAPLTRAGAFGRPEEIQTLTLEGSPSSDSSMLAMPPLQRSFNGGTLQPKCHDGPLSQQYAPDEGHLHPSNDAAWDLGREPDVSGWLPDDDNGATTDPHQQWNGSLHQQQPQCRQQRHTADDAEPPLHR